MSDSGLMELVKENRELHRRVEMLERAMSEQCVSIDKMMEQFKHSPLYQNLEEIDIAVSSVDMTLLSFEERFRGLSQRLAEELWRRHEKMAMKVMATKSLDGVTYRFLVFKVGK